MIFSPGLVSRLAGGPLLFSRNSRNPRLTSGIICRTFWVAGGISITDSTDSMDEAEGRFVAGGNLPTPGSCSSACWLLSNPSAPPMPDPTPETRRLAALDVGTNSTLFLLAEVDDAGRVRPLRHEAVTNDLGRGLSASGELSPEVIELNLRQLEDLTQIAVQDGAIEIRAAATEALRRAANATDLIARARAELGLEIRLISGQEEAALTYLGVASGLPDPAAPVLVADVGGGSSEVLLGQAGNVRFSVSLKVGAVSLDRSFIRHDPPLAPELDAIRRRLGEITPALADLRRQTGVPLVFCGGTASALAHADLGLADYQPEAISGHRLTRQRLDEFIAQFAAMPLEQRRIIPGIGRRRAEIILPGTLILAHLLEVLERAEAAVSERGLRYGLLLAPENWGEVH
ncbi:MAG: Ppx/GppA family phosphatase [Candidatus Zixiibacteriota bacterium]|nr:MAG: Ppx/GppA family phosphatase [candidate division Zixibacteria bacterium]